MSWVNYLNSLIISSLHFCIDNQFLSNSTQKPSSSSNRRKPGGSNTSRPKKSRNKPQKASRSKRQKTDELGKKPQSKRRNSAELARTNGSKDQAGKVKNSKDGTAGSETNKRSLNKVSAQEPAVSQSAYFVEVDENHAGQRLDNFLITRLKGVPRTHVYRIIRKGEVRINKGRAKQTTRLEIGDLVRIPPIRQSTNSTASVDGSRYAFLQKAILIEDDSLLVLNKPSGMAVHAGSGIKIGVIEALRALREDLPYLELVHRLDRDTSGCLVLAKKSSVLKSLHVDFANNSLKNNRLDKRYLCLVKGCWKHGERRVTKALDTNAKRHGERFVVVDKNGSYASSIMRPVAVLQESSLIEVKLLTGRTHQVRVHALSENHPLAGDQKYGDLEFNKMIKKQAGLTRLFLHAASIRFVHPVSEQSIKIDAPLPSELISVLTELGAETEVLVLDGQFKPE